MKIIALIINLLTIPAIICTAMAAMMSPMMFDAPGSENLVGLKIVMYTLISLPLLLIITNIFAWKKFIGGDYKGAIFTYKWVLLAVLIAISGLLMTNKG